MNMDLSTYCNTGDHAKCSGQPPTETMRKFLPPEMHDKTCACACHKEAA